MFVKPKKPGAVVRDPHTLRKLPANGANVPENSFWIRRLRAGDVVKVEPPKKDSQPKPVAKAKE